MSPQICVSRGDNGFSVANLFPERQGLGYGEPFSVLGSLIDYLQGMYGIDTSKLNLEDLKPGQRLEIPVG